MVIDEFYSHDNKRLLVNHLKEVYELSKDKVPEEYRDIYKVIAYCHDFGKYTSFFQNYLSKIGRKSKRSHHGFISAIFGAYVWYETYGYDDMNAIMVYSCILFHHGNEKELRNNLPNSPIEGIDDKYNDGNFLSNIRIVREQLEDMKVNVDVISNDYDKLGFGDCARNFICDDKLNIVLSTLRRQYNDIEDKECPDEYIKLQELYSALISADKLNACGAPLPVVKFADFDKLNENKIKGFAKKDKSISESQRRMNEIRTEIFNEVQNNLESLFKEGCTDKIFTITAPTGTGKTMTGFFAAQKLNKLLGGGRKIIYSLPFTSIIDQNYDAISGLYDDIDGYKKNDTEFLLKHHGLSNMEYNDEKINYTTNQAQILIENWESGVIITTFVQLLETLISGRNKMLKKFISMEHSILLLDEVQSIPVEYYSLVDYVLVKAAEEMDCYIIMMTATKPMIFNKEPRELLPDCKTYFSHFNRTKLIYHKEPCRVNDFLDRFKDIIIDKSTLIICNTIDESLKVYHQVKNNTGCTVHYLSTNLTSHDRKECIKTVSDALKAKMKVVLVATQVVEAGVDFDFDAVIRDVGPLDSIIQAAGRCNRNGNNHQGEVHIVEILSEKGCPYARIVYGKVSIEITKELLGNKNEIEEKDYYDMINDYFERVKRNKSREKSDNFIDSLERLRFIIAAPKKDPDKKPVKEEDPYAINNFHLIEDDKDKMEIFINENQEAGEILYKYKSAIETKDKNKKYEGLLRIRGKIQEYKISIKSFYIGDIELEDIFGIHVLGRHQTDIYYSKQTGFERQEKPKKKE